MVQFQVSGTLHEKEKGELWGGNGWELQGGVEERTGWEGEDKRTKWSEGGKEEKRGGEGKFLAFFFCVYYSF